MTTTERYSSASQQHGQGKQRRKRGTPVTSAGVVTGAALIMVAVFSIFVTMPLVELKILGVGMAAAILIDATVIRGVLLPAALSLLGERAWRLRRPRMNLPPPLPQAPR